MDANVVAQGFVDYNNFLGQLADPVLYARADSLNKLIQANPLDSTIASIDEIMTLEERQKINPLFSLINTQLSRGVILGLATEKDAGKLMNYLRAPEAEQFIPTNVKFAWERNGDSDVYSLYCLRDDEGKGIPKLSGRNIVDASASYDQAGRPETTMLMDSEGSAIWRTMTEEAATDNNRQIAIVLDSLVISAPSVTTTIANGSSSISMGSEGTITDKLERATDLAGLLKAGSLPAPSKIVDEVTVGATLGEDNINKGLMSFVIALLVVLLYMIFYYKGAGVVSDIALIANLFFLIGALAALGAALTLPGIAGIVLTIGMAVDANVLIYERIKEEMRGGKGLNLAVKDGYARAYSAIIDANLTTLLTAIVLKIFGSGPILGFANTLIIGIFTSLFSAIVITRLIFFSRLEGKKAISFYSNLTKDWFANTNFQFVKKRKMFYGISAVIIIAGIASLGIRGLQLGTDFTGGSSIDVVFVDENVDIQTLRTNLTDATTVDGIEGTPVVQSTDKAGAFRITTNYLINYTGTDQDEKIQEALATAFSPLGDYSIERYNKVTGNISDEFRRGALFATVFALAVIFLYLIFRFRKWQFGLGALIAMIHDVLIVLSLFSIFYGFLPFTMEVDLAFIAAILTVIGYSINDTVVVFDRIREYLGLYSKKKEEKEIVNDALNSTLSRTINTSISTFIVLLIIFVFGGSNIKGFIFALMVGVVVGTYSSIFIATPSVLDLSKKLTK
ncbi:MAG: protein translocase subunit SecD [Flavobacteriales bacterium]|nr:protein translocase subunit SecD [Flavobacteriales bacterium]